MIVESVCDRNRKKKKKMFESRVVEVVSESSDSESNGKHSEERTESSDSLFPVLLGSRAGAIFGVDDCDSNSDWDVVATLEWAQQKLGPQIWPQWEFEEAKQRKKSFFAVKLTWRDTLIDLTVPISDSSFASLLLRVDWKLKGLKKAKKAKIGFTGEEAIVAPIPFLYYVKQSHVRCENSLDWEKHMRKLQRICAGKIDYDQRVYPVLEAIRKQHIQLYGSYEERVEVSHGRQAGPRDFAMMAFDLGLTLQQFACRISDNEFSRLVGFYDKLVKEYKALTESSGNLQQPKRMDFSQQIARLWPSLPGDVHLLIFKRMQARDFRLMRTVCQAWKSFFDAEQNVRCIFQANFNEPFAASIISKPVFALEARELCGILSPTMRNVSNPTEAVKNCLQMRELLYVNHNLPAPRDLRGKEKDWLLFAAQNVVIVSPPVRTQGHLRGRELHETPKNLELLVWFPGHICSVSFHAGTEGSSQT